MFQFLKTILPVGAHYCALAIKGTQRKQIIIKDIADYQIFADYCVEHKIDAYFGLSSFKEGWHERNGKQVFRVQANAEFIKSFWMDIDVGVGKPYATVAEATEAFLGVRKAVFGEYADNFSLVTSGGGLHIYYPLSTQLPAGVWKQFAERLFAALSHAGLHVDPARARDESSVLRLPGTFNFKRDTARAVAVVKQGVPSDTVGIVRCITEYVRANKCNVTQVRTSNVDAEDRNNDALAIVRNCAQIRAQKDATEPVWRGMLSIMSFCSKGEKFAQVLSSQHPAYNADETAAKFDRVVAAGAGPYTCARFRAERPALCDGCLCATSSPISFGRVRQLPEVTAPEIVEVEPEFTAPTTQPAPGLMTLPTEGEADLPMPKDLKLKPFESPHYKISEDEAAFGVYAKSDDDDGEGSTKFTRVYRWVPRFIAHIKLALEVDIHPSAYLIDIVDEFGRVKRIEVRGDELNKQMLDGTFGKHSIILSPMGKNKIEGFMRAFIAQMESQVAPTHVEERLGLTEDKSSFLLGDRVYSADGVRPVLPRGDLYNVMRNTIAKGSIEPWKAAAELIAQPKMEWAQAVVGSSIGGVAMSLLGSNIKGVVASLCGPSGAGKSFVQQIALSVWGNAEEFKGTTADTHISRFQRMGQFNSIPTQFDDLSYMSTADVSSFAYQATQGRAKDASTDTGKVRHNPYRWSTITTLSTNTSLLDILKDRDGANDAEMRRIFELDAWSLHPHSKYNAIDAISRVSALSDNYGVVGHRVVAWMMKNRLAVTTTLNALMTRLADKYSIPSRDRFYLVYVTLCLFGIHLGNHMELFKYDIEAVESYLIKRLRTISSIADGEATPHRSILSDFLSETLDKQLTVRTHRRPREAGGVKIPDNPGDVSNDMSYVLSDVGRLSQMREISVRRCMEEREMYLRVSALKDWCKRRKVSYAELMKEIQSSGRYLGARSVRLGQGTELRHHDAVWALHVSLLPEEEIDETTT